MFDFNDQVVMITGAAGNLGRAAVNAFVAARATCVLVDERIDELAEAFPDLEASDKHLFIELDLLDMGSVEGMAYETVQQLGRIDVLVNIAGGFRMGSPVHEMPMETWDFMMDLNARTVVHTARAVVPHMLKQDSGKVINIAAYGARQGRAKMGAYVASKNAVTRLTETMAAELRAEGINVNCIMPGTIDTPENREAMPKSDHSKWVPPAALADVILFLASDAARAVHGACIPVRGLS